MNNWSKWTVLLILLINIVACGGGGSSSGTNTPPIVQNSAPVANAGVDQAVNTSSVVTLNASASSDANGDTLTFQWTLSTVPAGSTAALSAPTTTAPTFTADIDGSYVIQLVVNDGTVNSAADTVTVEATTPNTAPVANAGSDQNVNTGSTVNLTGAASTDANGDTLSYAWSFTSIPLGSTATISDTTVESPSFTADLDGDYVAQLIVNDGTVDSAAVTVTVEATTPNTAPVANAGSNQDVDTGATVNLSGAASADANGDTLSYAWSFLSIPPGSTASISDATIESPSFTTDLDGDYVAQLIVNDGTVDSAADSVTIAASTPNSAPVANAGVDQNVITGSQVNLDGSASADINGDTLTYIWSMTTFPAGSTAAISDTTIESPTFTADMNGDYVLQLIVNDGAVNSAADNVTISAFTPNSAPVANAGADQNENTGDLITLDGTASSDVDGDSLTFDWSLTPPAGSTAILSSSTDPSPTFTADIDGTYTAQLTVSDGSLDSQVDSVDIATTTANSAPVANAGIDQNINTGSLASLDGTASSDADGDNLTFLWNLTSVPVGSTASLNDAALASPSFTADIDGSYEAELTVNDGTVDSASDSVTILASTANSAPTANAGDDQNVVVDTLVNLDGSASSDVNGDAITYQWSMLSVPVGNTATITNDTSATPSFTPNVEGTYTVQLIVHDGQVSSAPDNVNIAVSVVNSAPVANAGDDQYVNTATSVILDGSGSTDANNDDLTYTWSFVSRPVGSVAAFNDPQAEMPSFTTDIEGSYIISLVVSDGMESSTADNMQVTVNDTTVSLTKKFGDFGNTFNPAPFPYSESVFLNISVGSPPPASIDINTFRITAQGGDVTIVNLQVTNETNNLVTSFTNLTEGMVLSDGVEVEFSLASPPTSGNPIEITYSFEILETGQTFFSGYTLTSN